MSTIKLSSITNKAKTSGPVIVGVTSSTAEGYARLASGDNSERVGIESGSIRYNETAKLLEFYDGETWNFIIPAEESANALGVFGGGGGLQYITISTLGDSTNFGDLTVSRGTLASCSSNTRGVFSGGTPNLNTIDYITISTTGNATDFGDLSLARGYLGSCSSSTRGVIGGGYDPIRNVIDYITIATTGNATDFGDLTAARFGVAACSSSTRGVFGGGATGGVDSGILNILDYVTIATTGNAIDFGDFLEATSFMASSSSSTRGVFGGRREGFVASTDVIEYITIATTGNSVFFGGLTQARGNGASCSSSTRAVFGGGFEPIFIGSNILDYITITSTGNALDFGDLIQADAGFTACSNNHGGLL